MAFQISPGVNVSEIDLTTVIPAVGTTGGAFAGPFQWGPLNEVVQVDSELTLVNEFGRPNSDVATQWFTVKNFLDYGNNLNLVRVAGANAKNSTSDASGVLIKNLDDYLTNFADGSAGKGNWAGKFPGILGNGLVVSMADSVNFASWTYKGHFTGVPGTSDYVAAKGGSNDELHVIVVDGSGLWTGVAGSILEIYSFISKAAGAKNADGSSNYYVDVINRNSKYIWWLDFPIGLNWGSDATTTFDGLETNLTLTGINGSFSPSDIINVYSAEVTSITLGAPNNGGHNFSSVPTVVFGGPNHGATAHAVLAATGVIKSVAINNGGSGYGTGTFTVPVSGTPGTGTVDVTVAGGAITTAVVNAEGSGFTSSSTLTNTSFDETVIPGGLATVTINVPGTGYTDGIYTVPVAGTPGTGTVRVTIIGGIIVAAVVLSAGSGFINGTSTLTNSAFDETGLGAGSNLDLSYTISGTGLSLSYVIGYAVGSVVVDFPGSGYQIAPAISFTGGTPTLAPTATSHLTFGGTPIKSAVVIAFNTPILTVSSILGTIAVNDTVVGASPSDNGVVSVSTVGVETDTLAGAVDANSLGIGGTHVTDGELINGFDLFANVEQIDISLLLTANYSQTVTEHVIQNVAELRKDAVAFVSPQFSDVVSNAGFEAASIVITRDTYASSSYAFMDGNWMYMYDKYNDVFRWVPCNGGVAGLAVATDQIRDPWFSFAGLNRGILKNVVKLAWNPSKTFRDTLYAAGVNPIVSFPGEGPVLFGDKTMLAKPSAFDRVNVRRLFIVLEKAISTASKFQLFEFNDAFTQAQFVSMVEPFLRDVQGRRGITDFRVVCDSSNNTPDVVDTNRFVGDIYIKPARSINFIQLNFVAVRTGVDFSEIVGKF